MSTRIINGRRPKNKRIERALLKKEPKVNENVKSAMFLRGPKTSEIINQVIADMYTLKKPHGIKFHRRNDTRPFEDQGSIEFFSNKNDCSLMAFGSHQKKRPHNLVLGRFFDHQVLDLIELGVSNFKSIQQHPGNLSYTVGFKPCFVFRGPEFEQKEEYKKFANLLLDILSTLLPCLPVAAALRFPLLSPVTSPIVLNSAVHFYRGEVTDQISLMGLDHVFVCTAVEGKIYFRHYSINLKKSGTNLPRVELEEIGPAMDLTIRRTRFAAHDLMKEALRQPRELKNRKVKNHPGTVINVHKEKQDLGQMQTRKMKGLKRKRAEGAANGEADGEANTEVAAAAEKDTTPKKKRADE
ncbi:Brix domain containing protein [Acanthamoeba castellanii str. Neff]|uniref:Ribosome production factor 2 homolog n=1 Tax=Acanthamoeba castellanii (strain ATCC 30010 / Neff) TaxID=1257118 RepID=L8GYU7_ACACF|nr:Brix domain containing protein [Acanthamoeba castellanii str. Neff]ELR18102.1 Brix domain containing protein [Acanthamoeba castellanii str. Neff]